MHVDIATLRPADRRELVQSLSFALKFNGKKPLNRDLSEMDANLLAGHLAEHLERSLFVVLKKPPVEPHSTHPRRTAP